MGYVTFPSAWQTEFLKYMPKEFPRNKGLYDRLTEPQHNVIKAYFKWRTQAKYQDLYKETRLRVSPQKIQKMKEVVGAVDDWKFGGIVDLGVKNGKCALGHPLRYEYYAISPSTNRSLIFGSTCASDFFDVSHDVLKQMEYVRTDTFDDIKQLLFILYTGRTCEYMTKYCSFLPALLNDPGAVGRISVDLKDGYAILTQMLTLGLPLPAALIQLLVPHNAQFMKEQKVLDTLKGLEDSELKKYAYQCMTKPYGFQPNLEYHASVGGVITGQRIEKQKEDIIGLLKLGLVLQNYTDTIERAVNAFNGIDMKAEKLYFINEKDTSRPAYSDEIKSHAKGLTVKYANPLEDNEWDLANTLVWVHNMRVLHLKVIYPEARKNGYWLNTFNELVKLRAKVYVALNKLGQFDFRAALDAREQYIKEIKAINEAQSPVSDTAKPENEHVTAQTPQVESKPPVTPTRPTEVTIEDVWAYLEKNKEAIPVPAIKDMLGRTQANRLSEKQRKFMTDVYRRMVRTETVKQPTVKPTPVAKPLADTPNPTKLFLAADTNTKRCAIIVTNDACRPLAANKYIGSNVQHMAEVFKNLPKEVEVIGTFNEAPQLCSTIYKEYTDLLYSSKEHEPFKQINHKQLSEVIGDKSVDNIKGELEFTDNQLKTYARKIFTDEGVIDNFLKDVTAQFLYYRKTVKGM